MEGRAFRRSRLFWLLAALLFAGIFARISLLSLLSERSKQIFVLEREIALVQREIGSLELQINEYHNLESIALRARQLGMEQPDETQIRVVHVNQMNMQDTSTQAAGFAGGEKVIQ